jgi:hypothetical protein
MGRFLNFVIEPPFRATCSAHADERDALGSEWREDDRYESIAQKAYCFEARSAILPRIRRSNDSSLEFKSVANVGEVKPMVDKVDLPLPLVPYDLHPRPAR